MILCEAEPRIIACLPTHVINLIINDKSLEILYLLNICKNNYVNTKCHNLEIAPLSFKKPIPYVYSTIHALCSTIVITETYHSVCQYLVIVSGFPFGDRQVTPRVMPGSICSDRPHGARRHSTRNAVSTCAPSNQIVSHVGKNDWRD